MVYRMRVRTERKDTREETRDRVEEAIIRIVECESFARQDVQVPLTGKTAREIFARTGILCSNNALGSHDDFYRKRLAFNNRYTTE